MSKRNREDAFAHAARALDFEAVRDMVASHCVNDAARGDVRAMAPRADRDWIENALAGIAEYRAFREAAGDVPIADTAWATAFGDSLRGLDTHALLAVASMERAVGEAKTMLSRDAAAWPGLAGHADELIPHTGLVEAIEHAIDTDGTVKDTASPALRKLRREIIAAKSALRAQSEKLARDFGEDTLTTIIGARHALVVPRTQVKRKDGLVHSQSHTGGSLYFEPFALIESNNNLETAVADERAEVARIVAELGTRVSDVADELLSNVDAMNRLDALRARAVFCERMRCATPAISSSRVRLTGARHPRLETLFGETTGDSELVPLDITLEPEERVMIITGPNAGGKTVAIKTLGTCVLMFQSGLQIPAFEGSELPVFHDVFVDIGDEQSMESSLSTFTSHLRNLDAMTRGANEHALCLIDEIGDGTDPDEGAAMAIATLERLLESGAAVVASTHYGRIKTFALGAPGVCNASMAFEDEQARPLFRLLQGIAGRSRGLEAARRTGFDARIVERAGELIGAEAFRLESILSDLEKSYLDCEREREELAQVRAKLESEREELAEKAAAYRMTEREAQRKSVREAQKIVTAARAEIEGIVRSIRERGADKVVIRESRRRVEALDASLDRQAHEAAEPTPLADVAAGDHVSVSASGKPAGKVISVDNGRAMVEINGKRITIPVDRLFPAADATPPPPRPVAIDANYEPLTTTTLDVRGHDREETLDVLADFVDRAVLAGVREVKVIHGIGEGILARAVGESLRDDPRVVSVRNGQQNEGGIGVTFATFE